jgi:hypothetical protein
MDPHLRAKSGIAARFRRLSTVTIWSITNGWPSDASNRIVCDIAELAEGPR